MHPSEMTLGELLARAAVSPAGVRFVDADERGRFHSYADLYERATRTATALLRLGVRPRDRVALVLSTSPGFYDAFFGTLLAGAVPVPLYPPVRLGRLDEYLTRTASLLRGSRVRLVLTESRIRRLLGRAVSAVGTELGCRTMRSLARRRGKGDPESCLPACPTPSEIAFIQHSSGTTGVPRPIRLSHSAIVANVSAIQARILEAYPEVDGRRHSAVSWLPLYHDMGLVGAVLTAMARPADLTLIPPELFVARPAIWLRALSRYGATISAAPNFGYALCTDRIREEELEGVDLSGWLVALNGAEPVSARTLRRFTRRFAPYGLRPEALTPVYGLAEATLAVTFCDPLTRFRECRFDGEALARDGIARPDAGGLSLVSVGRPLAGISVRIERPATQEEGPAGLPSGSNGSGNSDDGSRPIQASVVGTIWVRGPSLMDGYEDGSAGKERSPDGWLNTGDLGFVHNGELYVYGRSHDVIILRGRKYAPHVVERALEDVPGVRKGCVAAFSVPGGEQESLIVLVERVRDADPNDDARLGRAARRIIFERTGLSPTGLHVLEPGVLPRTTSGKIRRSEAKRQLLAGELRPPARVSALFLAREALRSRRARGATPRPGGDP